MDDIWDDSPTAGNDIQEAEWTRMSNEFTNVGYREGITAGKEAFLQPGFDDGFAKVGVPLGRHIGHLRGISAALVAFFKSSAAPSSPESQEVLKEAQSIATALSHIRFSDVVPRDLEAEQHALEHLHDKDEENETVEDIEMENEGLKDKRDVERLEDMFASLSSNAGNVVKSQRPTIEDVHRLRERLNALCEKVGLGVVSDLDLGEGPRILDCATSERS
ncbi:hypothetical protein CVT24_003674 [Panaeolus cyanescens]|uniref:Protein YAE1 n=1 Tax=Panaeolus cyanescens TaxID=181874 RepID=A0A409VUP7_9AGAR|nr:hypothetical protein CVT24_003674 [Panaeolus cyanescens]